jgi:parallel beta-helix repeat protein
MRKALVVVAILALVSIFAIPSGYCAAEVQDILLSKNDYIVGSTASAQAALQFTGPAPQLEDVNFTWFRPDMSIAKNESVTPDSVGLTVSHAVVDTIGQWWINASYSGDPAKYINRSMTVYSDSWSGTIYAEDWVVVGAGTALSIADGSDIRFSNDTGLRIEGALSAENVLFTSNESSPSQGDWDSILFWSNSNPTSIFQNNTIEYADDGVKVYTVPHAISYNTFRGNVNGMTLFSSSTMISNNEFLNNAKGIELYGGSPTIADNTFDGNNYGIRILTSSDATMNGNTIQNTGQTAIYVGGSNAVMAHNTVQQGLGSGIYFADGSSGLVENTTVSGFTDGVFAGSSQLITIKDSAISSNSARNIYVYNANVTAINYTLKQGLSAQQGGQIHFKNYLTVSVNRTDGSKVANAVVSVYRDSQSETSSVTDSAGITPPMLVLDRTLTSSGNIESVTRVDVSVIGMAFANNSRAVDMSTSHTEYFVGSPHDNDGDGEPDFSDQDDDNDNLWDAVETGLGTDPFNPDSDGDGLIDGLEVNEIGSDPLLVDTDGDGFTDKEEYDAGTSAVNPENHPEDTTEPDDDEDTDSGNDLVSAAAIFAFQVIAFLMMLSFVRQRRGKAKE